MDEKIYQELEVAIDELNRQDLTTFGGESALKLAVLVVKLANGIINTTTGEDYSDLQERAGESLNQFQVSMSSERLEAEYLVNEGDTYGKRSYRVINFCGVMIPQLQQERLQKLNQELQFAINTNNISSMEYHSQEPRRELQNLPDEVQLVQGCILAIQQAKAVAPT